MPDVCVKFIDDDLCSQKCLIPYDLLEGSGIRPGDIVSIHHGSCIYLCSVFILPPSKIERNISISVTVSVNVNFNSQFRQITYHHLPFPEAFNVEKVATFEHLTVEIIFNKLHFDLNLNHYQNIVSCLLRNIVFCKGASINCSSTEIAKMFSIVEIKIKETHLPGHVCGKISRATNLNVGKFSFPEEVNVTRDFEKITEMTSIYNTQKLLCYTKSDKMIIITGPSGCGKSVLVKKLCLDFKCTFTMIDCLKKSDLTAEKCNEYFQYLTQSSTNSMSMLLIDHIDKFSHASSKVKPSPVSILIQLLQRLETSKVCVVATAVRKNLVHPALEVFFKEVTIGVLSVEQRKKILSATLNLSDSHIDLDKVASTLQSFVACDIVQLCEKVVKSKEQYVSDGINKLTNQDFEDALFNFTPSLLKSSAWNMKVKPVRWDEIGGMDRIKERLQMCVEKPLLHPEVFDDLGLHCPNGVLLFGPPGCCKTTLARGLATECKANFFAANPSQIYSAYVGESEKNICELFYQARLCPPSIIFLDELDSLVGSRDVNTKQQGVAEKVLSTLLNEMDGSSIRTNVQSNYYDLKQTSEETVDEEKSRKNQVIVVAATNRPDCIDSALLRPGRFDVILYIPPPNYGERISILETITRGMPLVDVDFNKIAEKTEYFTGADLKNLVTMAAMNAFREDKINAEYIGQDHFIQALQYTKPSITKEQLSMYEQLSIKYGLVVSEERV